MYRVKALVLVAMGFLMTGCGALILFGAGTAAGVAGYQYYQGALHVVFQTPFMKHLNGLRIVNKGAIDKNILIGCMYFINYSEQSISHAHAESRIFCQLDFHPGKLLSPPG